MAFNCVKVVRDVCSCEVELRGLQIAYIAVTENTSYQNIKAVFFLAHWIFSPKMENILLAFCSYPARLKVDRIDDTGQSSLQRSEEYPDEERHRAISHLTPTYWKCLLPPANEVWGKVMFLHLCIILFTEPEGVYLPVGRPWGREGLPGKGLHLTPPGLSTGSA